MAFVNVNKVRLEDTDDIVQALSNTLLLFSSFIYEASQESNTDKVLSNAIQVHNTVNFLIEAIDALKQNKTDEK